MMLIIMLPYLSIYWQMWLHLFINLHPEGAETVITDNVHTQAKSICLANLLY